MEQRKNAREQQEQAKHIEDRANVSRGGRCSRYTAGEGNGGEAQRHRQLQPPVQKKREDAVREVNQKKPPKLGSVMEPESIEKEPLQGEGYRPIVVDLLRKEMEKCAVRLVDLSGQVADFV